MGVSHRLSLLVVYIGIAINRPTSCTGKRGTEGAAAFYEVIIVGFHVYVDPTLHYSPKDPSRLAIQGRKLLSTSAPANSTAPIPSQSQADTFIIENRLPQATPIALPRTGGNTFPGPLSGVYASARAEGEASTPVCTPFNPKCLLRSI